MSKRVSDKRGFYPDFYQGVDKGSIAGQKEYVNAFKWQLAGLLAAAVFGAFTWKFRNTSFDYAGFIAACGFSLALLVRIYLSKSRPDKKWYGGRAAAESAKTLTWRFAVCADPFPRSMQESEAIRLFIGRLGDVRKKLEGVLIPPFPSTHGEVTDLMRNLRKATFEVRKERYLSDRILDQQNWYAEKSYENATNSSRWSKIMLTLEFFGLVGAILKTAGVVNIDFLALASAVVATFIAWTEMRQHDNLASAYLVAANELSAAHALGLEVDDEGAWSEFVANAEEAISREHTMWVASR